MVRQIVPWMGGKRRLVKHLLPEIDGFPTYVEGFCGGASLFFAKTESKAEVLNDINGDLVNLYRVVQHHLDELVRIFRWALVSREGFQQEKAKDPATLTDIQRAARFYYLAKTCFGGQMASLNFGTARNRRPRLNLLRMEEDLSAAHLRLARVTIENMDWKALTARYDGPDTCFYLDLPYWRVTGYGRAFPFGEYEALAALARQAKGKGVISINDHPDIRAAFTGLTMRQVDTTYTSGKGHTKARELIITNR